MLGLAQLNVTGVPLLSMMLLFSGYLSTIAKPALLAENMVCIKSLIRFELELFGENKQDKDSRGRVSKGPNDGTGLGGTISLAGIVVCYKVPGHSFNTQHKTGF